MHLDKQSLIPFRIGLDMNEEKLFSLRNNFLLMTLCIATGLPIISLMSSMNEFFIVFESILKFLMKVGPSLARNERK